MPRKSTALRLLELVSVSDLREFARHRGLSPSGNKAQLAARIAADAKRDVGAIVSRRGSPWSTEQWNDFVEWHFQGRRRRSFEDIRDEIERGLDGAVEALFARMQAVGEFSLAEIRRDDELLKQYADILEITPRKLSNAIGEHHGNVLISSIWAQLVARFEPTGGRAEKDMRELEEPASIAKTVASKTASTSASRTVAAHSLHTAPTRLLEKPPLGYRLRDRWRITSFLGQGGFGTAWEVVDELLASRGTFVAKLASTDRAVADLEHELEAALHVSHQNICKYHTLDLDSRFGPFLIIQHGGQSLTRLHERSPAPVAVAIRYIEQAARGLDALVEHNIQHGDVSPSNILVDAAGRVRLTDFGIASTMRTAEGTHGITRVADVLGFNKHFASPEALAFKPLRRSSDQASLAKVFCALLQGISSFLEDPHFYFPELHPSQNAALDRALLHDATRRFPSCTEFVRSLGTSV